MMTQTLAPNFLSNQIQPNFFTGLLLPLDYSSEFPLIQNRTIHKLKQSEIK